MRRYEAKEHGQKPYTPEQKVSGFLAAVTFGQLSPLTEKDWARQLQADFETGRLLKHVNRVLNGE